MRIDQDASPDSSPDPSPDRPETARPGTRWASTAALALLMAGTCWVVASWVSPWLVPPYLVLMALLLSPSSPSTRRPQDGPGSEASETLESSRPARPDGDSDDSDPPSDASDSLESPDDGSEQGAASKPSRARRGKGRVKKAKSWPEPAEATWVQVAPGKFVRVGAADGSTGLAGPHPQVGAPVEVPRAPHRLESEGSEDHDRPEGPAHDQAPPGDSSGAGPEIPIVEPDPFAGPIEDAGPAFDPVEGPEGDPTGAFVSEPSPSIEAEGEPADSSETLEGPSAADGNAPQSEDLPESPGASPPQASPEIAAEGWPSVEPVEGGPEADDESSAFDHPEPVETGALADAPPEEDDEPGATFEGADPTETPVDETDLDDAGPLEPAPRDPDPSEDAGPSATELLPGSSQGPTCWPWTFKSRARTRVGPIPPRRTGRTPTRRPARSREPARRPHDPRRLGRQGLARPRQVNRTFPPRSPPSTGRPWRRNPIDSWSRRGQMARTIGLDLPRGDDGALKRSTREAQDRDRRRNPGRRSPGLADPPLP